MSETCKLQDTKARVEALLAAAKGRLRLSFIAASLQLPKDDVEFALYDLQSQMSESDRGVTLNHNQAGWRLEIKPEYQKEIARVFPERAFQPLSHQALEVLAVVAYLQPVSLADIDGVRKVESASSLLTLRKRKLVTSHRKGLKRERLWSTTPAFLELYNLKSPKDLFLPGVLEKTFDRIAP